MMRAVFKGALAAAFLAGSSLAATAPAQAHDRTGPAIIAGLLGLGIGAAIASDSHNRYDRGDRGYAYEASPTYYAPTYSYGGYGYDRSYYSGRRYGGGRRGDWQERRWHDHDGWNRRDRDDRDGGEYYYGR